MGFVFQDPYDSLNARMTIGEIVAEPMRIHGMNRREALGRAAELLQAVGLPDAPLDSRPARYSGGGRQRIAVARALALDPDVLICDEPTASLDVSVQAQILNLLFDLRDAHDLSMIFVSHDLDIIRRISDEMVVLYSGRIMETGDADAIHAHPRHHYTAALLDAVPTTDPRHRRAHHAAAVDEADAAPPTGCVFAARCPRVEEICREGTPPLRSTETGTVACHFPIPATAGRPSRTVPATDAPTDTEARPNE
jgi:peptide/nickel transport system ATP-binding protein